MEESGQDASQPGTVAYPWGAALLTRTQYFCACSLDGFIADADREIDWLTGYEGQFDDPDAEPTAGSYDRFYSGVGALTMGSATYEWILGHIAGGRDWPYSGKPAWVMTTRDLPLPEGDSVDVRFADAAVADLYDEMIAAAGERNLWVVGGGNVASQFADGGLLDEVLVTVVPVVLGAGTPLFDRRLPGAPMQLAGMRALDSGMVELRYEIEHEGRPGRRAR